jgi:HEAT repeat protein
MDSSTGFHVYSSGRKGRGSKLLTATVVIVGVAVVGGGVAFWFDRPRLVKHVAERSHLALPAAWALGTQGPPPEAREPLVAALETGEPRLRALAARALGGYRSRDLVAELGKAAVSDADASVRRAAVAALDHVGESNAIPFIRHALGDGDPGVQAAACSGVATFGLTDQIPLLIDFLGSMDSDLRLGAKRALVRFLPDGEAGWEYDREAWTHWYASGGQRR